MTDKEKNYLEALLKQSQVETSDGFTDNVLNAVRQSEALKERNPAPKPVYLPLVLGMGLIIHFLGFRMLSLAASNGPLSEGMLAVKIIFSLVLLLLLNTGVNVLADWWPIIQEAQRKNLA